MNNPNPFADVPSQQSSPTESQLSVMYQELEQLTAAVENLSMKLQAVKRESTDKDANSKLVFKEPVGSSPLVRRLHDMTCHIRGVTLSLDKLCASVEL